jgi:tetratricopeptide (TPR) repeat protein
MASHKKTHEDPKLLETVQMFEVITAANPDDYQSMEILKEAYSKLGREKDSIEASKKIAKIYVRLGQISSAILEYEGVLQRSPDDAEALVALGELESRMPGYAAVAEAPEEVIEEERPSGPVVVDENAAELLVDFLIQHGLFQEKHRTAVLSAYAAKHAEAQVGMPPPCVLDVLAERGITPMDDSLLFLTQTAKLPFLPMESYDVDLKRVDLIDRELCVTRLVLPFDQISRTVFAATLNPFDRYARRAVEEAAGCRVQWFLTKPDDLRFKLKDVFRLLG